MKSSFESNRVSVTPRPIFAKLNMVTANPWSLASSGTNPDDGVNAGIGASLGMGAGDGISTTEAIFVAFGWFGVLGLGLCEVWMPAFVVAKTRPTMGEGTGVGTGVLIAAGEPFSIDKLVIGQDF